jgi:hypothetical protein
VEKRGQQAKLEGGEVEGGQLAAHLRGEVLGGLAEVNVGGEGAGRLVLGGGVAVRIAPAALANRLNLPLVAHKSELDGPRRAPMDPDGH